MNKQAPSAGKIVTMVLFAASCIGLLLFLWISFGGAVPFAAQGYRMKVEFKDAVQLGVQSDVRISGVSVGKVVAVSLDRHTGLTKAVIQIDPKYAPRPSSEPCASRQTLPNFCLVSRRSPADFALSKSENARAYC